MAPKFQKGPDLKRFMVCDRHVCPVHGNSLTVQSRAALSRTIRACVCVCVVSVVGSPLRASLSQDKRLKVCLNAHRTITGTLRGYDAFLNIVLEDVEQEETGQYLGQVVVRGNSIVQLEGLERAAAATAAPPTAAATS